MSIRAQFLFFCLNFVFISNILATPPCTPISKLPYTISSSGNYCLTGNLVNLIDHHAIKITASNVVLNLQNFTIDTNNKRTDNSKAGIFAADCRNITIKNGIIKGFFYGIYLKDKQGSDTNLYSSSGDYVIDKIKISGSFFRGIRTEGVDSHIKNSTITNIGGTTIHNNALIIGIETIGPNAVIENNMISDIHSTGGAESVGLSFSNNSQNSSASGNTIINKKSLLEYFTPRNKGDKFGIWVGGNPKFQTNVAVRNNKINNMTYGIAFSSPTSGSYENNQIKQSGKCDYLISSEAVSTLDHKSAVGCNN